jgi:opacity protein-like surface antigen
MNFKMYKITLIYILVLTAYFHEEACASGFFLKLDFPVAMESIGDKFGQDSSVLSAYSHTKRSTANLKPFPVHQIGLGYTTSDYFEAELMYGLSRYSFQKDYLSTNAIAFNPAFGHTLFGFAFTSPSAFCSSDPLSFINAHDICVGGGGTSTSVASLKVTGMLSTLIGSVKYKPFKRIKLFSPYISLGAGVAHSNSKYKTAIFSTFPGNVTAPSGKMKSTALALEFGAGTKVQVTKAIDLDFSIKYFNYGNHAIAHNVSRKFSGYKFTIGATFLLQPPHNHSYF